MAASGQNVSPVFQPAKRWSETVAGSGRALLNFARPADWKVGDTAGKNACATTLSTALGLMKQASSQELLVAIRRVLRGKFYLSEAMTRRRLRILDYRSDILPNILPSER